MIGCRELQVEVMCFRQLSNGDAARAERMIANIRDVYEHVAKLEAALKELVACKDLRIALTDAIEGHPGQVTGRSRRH